MVICLNYGHFEKKLRSMIVSQNHYLNQILDVHPLCKIKFSSAQEPRLPVPQPNDQSQFYSAPMSDPIMGVGKPRMKWQTFCFVNQIFSHYHGPSQGH